MECCYFYFIDKVGVSRVTGIYDLYLEYVFVIALLHSLILRIKTNKSSGCEAKLCSWLFHSHPLWDC